MRPTRARAHPPRAMSRQKRAYARQSRAASRPRRAGARCAYPSFAALLPRWRLPFTWPQVERVVKSIKESDKESTKEVNPDPIAAVLAESAAD